MMRCVILAVVLTWRLEVLRLEAVALQVIEQVTNIPAVSVTSSGHLPSGWGVVEQTVDSSD